MKCGIFILGIVSSFVISGCGVDTSRCDSATHCLLQESGEAVCEAGYQWASPDEAGNFLCEVIPVITSPVTAFGTSNREFKVVATTNDGLNIPRDLEFHPDRPNELWTVNKGSEGVVILFDPDTPKAKAEKRDDMARSHFMAQVSSLAFGAADTFATCQESRNGVGDSGDDFMGPTLWPGDLDIFAAVNQNPWGDKLGSHLDMNHQSPNCMGIAHDSGNAYWVFDGHNGHVVYYDFQQDHGPGNDDHSDGIVRRYTEATVSRVAGIPSHMVLDKDSGLLYIADTGNSRIMVLDTNSGSFERRLPLVNEPLAEFSEYTNAKVREFAENSPLRRPSGIALSGNTLFVTDNSTNEIIAYDLDGNELDRISSPAEELAGITVGPSGNIWLADMAGKIWKLIP